MPLKIGKKRVGREGRPQPICLQPQAMVKSRPVSQRLMFIRPLSPSAAVRPPQGDDWIHEPKWVGFRFQIIKDGSSVRLYSRHGADYTDRLPGMVEAFGKLPTQTAILDGELCLIDPRGAAHFTGSWPRCAQIPGRVPANVLVFDILHQDNIDLRALPLSERKRDLTRLCRKSKVPFLKEVQTFPNGTLLLDHCNKFGFEGVVSKRLASRYSSGPIAQLGQDEMPRLEAHQCRALAHFRRPEQAGDDGSTEDAREEARRTRPRSRAPGGSRFAPGHREGAAQARGYSGAGDRRIGSGLRVSEVVVLMVRCSLNSETFNLFAGGAVGFEPIPVVRSSWRGAAPCVAPTKPPRVGTLGDKRSFPRHLIRNN